MHCRPASRAPDKRRIAAKEQKDPKEIKKQKKQRRGLTPTYSIGCLSLRPSVDSIFFAILAFFCGYSRSHQEHEPRDKGTKICYVLGMQTVGVRGSACAWVGGIRPRADFFSGLVKAP